MVRTQYTIAADEPGVCLWKHRGPDTYLERGSPCTVLEGSQFTIVDEHLAADVRAALEQWTLHHCVPVWCAAPRTTDWSSFLDRGMEAAKLLKRQVGDDATVRFAGYSSLPVEPARESVAVGVDGPVHAADKAELLRFVETLRRIEESAGLNDKTVTDNLRQRYALYLYEKGLRRERVEQFWLALCRA
jgi:hypothetical protein